jgi:hypothetical protein
METVMENSDSDRAIRVGIHLSIAVASVVFLGSTRHYFGLSGRVVFILAGIIIFIAFALGSRDKKRKS